MADDVGDMGEGNEFVEGVTSKFLFSEQSLSTHFLFLGSPGTGKTNAIVQFVNLIKEHMMKENDVMIIFDTKGDYLSLFYDPSRGDKVISNDPKGEGWNLFEEIKQDPPEKWEQDAFEIALEVFDESKRATKDQYFPMAAADVVRATLIALLRYSQAESEKISNKDLYTLLANRSSEDLVKVIGSHPDLAGSIVHIMSPGSPQTQGVMGQIKEVMQEIFSGRFGQEGDFSVRRFIRERGGKTLFLEYDETYGKLLTPIYRLIIDLAIKEALGRVEAGKGNIYFVIDEFALLPNLYHIEDGINFGRGLGVKFLVGTQNVNQISSSYGEERAKSILASFGTVFAFRLHDRESKDVLSARYGKYMALVTVASPVASDPLHYMTVEAEVVEPLQLSLLRTGQAIVSISGQQPRFFQFRRAEDVIGIRSKNSIAKFP